LLLKITVSSVFGSFVGLAVSVGWFYLEVAGLRESGGLGVFFTG
jgi:hypothetical protein